jgi:hypothetical protein
MASPGNRRPAPKLTLSRLEWKLGLTTALASAYALMLVSVGRPSPIAPAANLAGAAPAVTAAVASGSPSIAPRPATTSLALAQPRIRTRSS